MKLSTLNIILIIAIFALIYILYKIQESFTITPDPNITETPMPSYSPTLSPGISPSISPSISPMIISGYQSFIDKEKGGVINVYNPSVRKF